MFDALLDPPPLLPALIFAGGPIGALAGSGV